MPPIRPENRGRYPSDWPEIRARILKRAAGCCEQCGKPDRVVVAVLPDGRWGVPFDPLEHPDDHLRRPWRWRDEHGRPSPAPTASDPPPRDVLVVLTVAHLDHTPEHCDDDNLRAWCQRCHNRYDAPHRATTRARTRQLAAEQAGQRVLELDHEDDDEVRP